MLKMMYKWTRDFEQSRDGFEAKLKIFDEKVIRLRDNNNLDFTRSCLKTKESYYEKNEWRNKHDSKTVPNNR